MVTMPPPAQKPSGTSFNVNEVDSLADALRRIKQVGEDYEAGLAVPFGSDVSFQQWAIGYINQVLSASPAGVAAKTA
jgi:hypothetical protein